MNDELAGLLGVNLPKAKEEAFTKGLLGAIFQAAALSGPQRSPVGTAQGLGQIGLTALGGYESAMDKTLEQAIKGLQVRDLMAKRAEEERLRKARADYETRLAGAVKTVPSTNLTEGGQQAAMLAQQMEGFAPEDYAGTQQALFGAGATRQAVDEAAANRATLDFIRQSAPLEYAKLTFKGSDEPEQIKTLRALLKDPALMNAYLGVKKAGAPSTEVKLDMANRQAMFKEVDVPIIQGFTNSASSAREFAQVSNTINNLLKGKGGGALVQVGTDVARTLGVNPGQVSAADLAQSLVTQAAPRMRAPGSGSTSDMEFKAYMNSIPSLASSEPGRELMAKYSSAFAERSAKLADYARKLAAKDELSFEAIQKYDESLGPVLKDDFLKFAPQPGGVVDFRSGTRGGR